MFLYKVDERQSDPKYITLELSAAFKMRPHFLPKGRPTTILKVVDAGQPVEPPAPWRGQDVQEYWADVEADNRVGQRTFRFYLPHPLLPDLSKMKHKPVYTDEITKMMFVSGETAEPSTETTWIIEEIVRQQVIEIVSGMIISLFV